MPRKVPLHWGQAQPSSQREPAASPTTTPVPCCDSCESTYSSHPDGVQPHVVDGLEILNRAGRCTGQICTHSIEQPSLLRTVLCKRRYLMTSAPTTAILIIVLLAQEGLSVTVKHMQSLHGSNIQRDKLEERAEPGDSSKIPSGTIRIGAAALLRQSARQEARSSTHLAHLEKGERMGPAPTKASRQD